MDPSDIFALSRSTDLLKKIPLDPSTSVSSAHRRVDHERQYRTCLTLSSKNIKPKDIECWLLKKENGAKCAQVR